jgi:uncharacterized protein with NAD-binding domain and iron-sulfur cluster
VLIQIVCCLLKRLGLELKPGALPTPVTPPVSSTGQQNVVILGGGVAGVVAAFWLTAPQQSNRFKVTLYTQGWRLGGKCASGRNQNQSNRIEEHGLHLLMGCYQNAFATIRSCYEVWYRPAGHPFRTWLDAFLPQRDVTLMEQDGPGMPPTWAPWDFPDFPRLPGEPGDPLSSAPFWAAADAARANTATGAIPPVTITAPVAQTAATPAQSMEQLMLRMIDLLRTLDTPQDLANNYQTALARFHEAVSSPTTAQVTSALASLEALNREYATLTQQAAATAPRAMAAVAAVGPPWPASRSINLASIGMAIGYGYLRDILGRGEEAYDALNSQDFRDWLASCWATPEALDSAPIRAIYDLAFAFAGGDASTLSNGSMAAGVTLRFACEVAFGYRDAPLWRMAAGTGDTVFVPLYQVLQDRGVDIQFFHRVTELRPAADGLSVGEIDLSRQADTLGGAPYQPLINVSSLSSWPNQPDWNQLVNGNVLRGQNPDYESSFCTETVGTVTLKAGTDYDLAVVAMPPAVLSTVASPLASVSPAWQTSLSQSRSVATAAMQLWMHDSTPCLGWPYGPAVLSAFAEPYDSWGDMSAIITYEGWPLPAAPKSLAYFCGCMMLPTNGPINPTTMLELVVANGDKWLSGNIQYLWPSASVPATWAQTGAEIARLDKANFDVSDLYVQTPAGGNVASRFSSDRTAGFRNLYVVGDWTKTRFSGGCFESAVESAMLVANSLGGFPPLAEIKTI